MTLRDDPLPSRRAFLRFLAGSPLLSFAGLQACTMDREERSRSAQELNQLITSSDDALNVFDFEAVARNNLPPAHFGYMATGVDDDATLRANREGYSRLFVRPRRLVDVTNIDMSVELFGERWESPIVISPTGSQRAFHPQGELAVANAARTRNHLQILSTVTTTSVEDVTEARGAPVWYQLYPTSNWTVTQALLRRAEAAGSPVVVLTVDMPAGGNRETVERYARIDSRDCTACHDDGTFARSVRRMPPSTRTGIRPPTASTTSGKLSIVARLLSTARPPWFDTMIPSAPYCTQRAASPRVTIPLMTTRMSVLSLSRRTKSQVSPGADSPVTPVKSSPSNIGLRRT